MEIIFFKFRKKLIYNNFMIICSNRYIGAIERPFETEASFHTPEEPMHAVSQIAVG